MSIIEIKNLVKNYGNVKAIKDITCNIGEGQLYAFLGTTGAGKSTLVNILAGQTPKTKGQIIINGYDMDIEAELIKSEVGMVFEKSYLDSQLSAIDNLRYRAGMYGIVGKEFEERLNVLARLLDIRNSLKYPVETLSIGKRRRIDIARALIHKPSILILDEPTFGLDPRNRRLIWHLINELRETENLTVVLTTHYSEEAQEADKIAIIDAGRIVAEGSAVELKNHYVGDFITVYSDNPDDVRGLGIEFEYVKDGFRLSVPDTVAATALITSHPSVFMDYEITKGTLDDVFFEATGKDLIGGNEQ